MMQVMRSDEINFRKAFARMAGRRFQCSVARVTVSLAMFSACFTLPGCAMQRFEYTRLCMGVRANVVLYAGNEHAAFDAAAAAFERIGQLDAILSDYRRDSEAMRLCTHPPNAPIQVSDDLFNALQASLASSCRSNGAFDITVGPLTAIWREARNHRTLPDPQSIEAARASVGWHSITLDGSRRTATLHQPNMRLDFGGIGKGLAAQQAVDLLQSRGMNRCLVALAGDIVAGDSPPDRDGWVIDTPHGRSMLLHNAAVSTSGDLEQFIDINGVRYSHIIDPRTGMPVTNQIIVTVIAPRGETADALSTAACVVDEQHIESMLASFPGAAAIISKDESMNRSPHVIDPAKRVHWSASPGARP